MVPQSKVIDTHTLKGRSIGIWKMSNKVDTTKITGGEQVILTNVTPVSCQTIVTVNKTVTPSVAIPNVGSSKCRAERTI